MLHKLATKERKEIKGTTKQKMAKRHSKGGNHLATWKRKAVDGIQWKELLDGYILQGMDIA